MKSNLSKRLLQLENRINDNSDISDVIVIRVKDSYLNGGGIMPVLSWKVSGAGLDDINIMLRINETEDQLWQRIEMYMDEKRRRDLLFLVMQIAEHKHHESITITNAKPIDYSEITHHDFL